MQIRAGVGCVPASGQYRQGEHIRGALLHTACRISLYYLASSFE